MADEATLAPDQVPVRIPDVRIRRFRGKVLVASAHTALELDEVASFIFTRVDGVATVAAIGEMLAGEFGISVAEAVADTAELLTQLVGAGIVEACAAPAERGGSG